MPAAVNCAAQTPCPMAILPTTPGGALEGANTEISESRAAIMDSVRAKPLGFRARQQGPGGVEKRIPALGARHGAAQRRPE